MGELDECGKLVAQMPLHVAEIVRELLACSLKVWLFGSRVNPVDRPARDWHVLVFGDLDLLNEFQKRHLLPISISLLCGTVTNSSRPRSSTTNSACAAAVSWAGAGTRPARGKRDTVQQSCYRMAWYRPSGIGR